MESDLALYSKILRSAPANPFLPRESDYGPSFLDTSACLCSLRKVEQNGVGDEVGDDISDETGDDRKRATKDVAAWQCIGNQTQGVYEVTTGKWFENLQGGSDVNLPIYDDSNDPKVDKALTWDEDKNDFVDADLDSLSLYDRACTAINQTTFSTSFYRVLAEQEAGEDPIDAASCWRSGSVPVEIQNVTSWSDTGCPSGFLCSSTLSISSLQAY